jgi:hypothetical protein
MDWSRLAPHRPLGVGDVLRVERPGNNGERLAAMIKARMSPIAIMGPVGCGKSTELAAAAQALHADFVTVLVQLDRLMDMRQFDEVRMFNLIGNRLAYVASTVLHLDLSKDALKFTAFPPEGTIFPIGLGRSAFLSLIREVSRKSTQGRMALLLDGLEKCPGELAKQAIRALLSAREDAEIAVVAPLELVTGPEGYEILTEMRAFSIRPVPVLDEAGKRAEDHSTGHEFLRKVFLRRMGLSKPEPLLEEILLTAAMASSGLPRTFLQLLRDAGGYASIANREIPNDDDLRAAILDQKESLQRLLRDGDLAALKSAEGTEGRELSLDRRIRFLTHGLLLEYEVGGRVVVHTNKLLRYEGSNVS